MEQFNLEEWLKDKSRKICTRDGRIVEILKVDAKGNHPIIGIYQFSDTEDMESSWRIDGRKTENRESFLDLFFADEEEKLTEFEKAIKKLIESCCNEVEEANITNAGAKEISSHILDLARKELLKDLPKWKKGTPPSATTLYVIRKGYYMTIKEVDKLFETLPKEE